MISYTRTGNVTREILTMEIQIELILSISFILKTR